MSDQLSLFGSNDAIRNAGLQESRSDEPQGVDWLYQECKIEKNGKGWLVERVMEFDGKYNGNRWGWWTLAFMSGRLPSEPIPRISFDHADPGVIHELESVVSSFHRVLGSHSFEFLVDELLYALGYESPERVALYGSDHRDVDPLHVRFCEEFDLEPLMRKPYDYLGEMLVQMKSGGKGKFCNPNAFYPTPMPLCVLMAEINMGQEYGKDWRAAAVKKAHDPCMGTGRTLLAASNYCLQLSGQDIDPLVLKIARVNAKLYAPWLAVPGGSRVSEIVEYNALRRAV